MAIEPFGFHDLSQLDPLQPHGWASITPSFHFYVHNDFCLPLKFTSGGKVIGVGTAILHQKTAWLAHIIVDTNFRNQGIGTKITRELITAVQQSGHKTISLIASAPGEPVYRKLGFIKDTDYLFFKGTKVSSFPERKSTAFESKFKNQLLDLDAKVSGENRSRLLAPHLENSRLILEHKELTGFYLPSLGEGLILANTKEAGISLLIEKHGETEGRIVLPKENDDGISFLLKNGFTQFLTGSRMHLGPGLNFYPAMIYNRIGGNLG